MDKEVKEILEEILSKQKAFATYAKMYIDDEEKAKQFVRMLYEQSHVKYLRRVLAMTL